MFLSKSLNPSSHFKKKKKIKGEDGSPNQNAMSPLTIWQMKVNFKFFLFSFNKKREFKFYLKHKYI